MLISKVLDSPPTSRALQRAAGGRLWGLASKARAQVPFSLFATIALALVAMTAVESVQAQTTTGFRIVKDNESRPCVAPDPDTDPPTKLAPAVRDTTAIMVENTQAFTSNAPTFEVCEMPAGASVTWAFNATRRTDFGDFRIGIADGSLSYVGEGEDYEAFGNNGMRAYTLRITARHDGGPSGTPKETSATVYVDITNVNEAPKFSGTIDDAMNMHDGEYDFELPEGLVGSTTPYELGPISVADPEGDFIALTVTPESMFDILDGKTLRYKGPGQNYDTQGGTSETAMLEATDGGNNIDSPGQRRPATVDANVRIIDYPLFDQVFKPEDGGEYKYKYAFSLKEGTTNLAVLGIVQAASLTGLPVKYTIQGTPACDNTGTQSLCTYKDSLAVDLTTGAITYIGKQPAPLAIVASQIPKITLMIMGEEQKEGCGTVGNSACESSLATVEIEHTGAGGLLTFPGGSLTINLPENEATSAALTPDVRTATGGRPPYTYSLTGTRSNLFTISTTDGRIRYTGSGESSDFAFTLQLRDAAGTTRTRTVTVDVGGTGGGGGGGTNRAPIFTRSTYTFDLDRNEAGPVSLGNVNFSDPDDDALTASLSGTGSTLFSLSNSGALRYEGAGETGTPPSYRFTATIEDPDGLTDTATITVTVDAAGSGIPVFPDGGFTFDLPEDSESEDEVGVAKATVRANIAIAYSLEDAPAGKFRITLSTAAITYHGSGEDFETPPSSYTFKVRAQAPDTAVFADVTVNVTDVNENPGFANTNYAFDIKENIASGETVGTVVAIDPDASSTLTYSLSGSGANRFAVNAGKITYAGPGEDFETLPNQYTITLTAKDQGELEATTTVTVNVTDVIEAPVFANDSYNFNLRENMAGPVRLGMAVATHSEGTNFTYSLEGAGAVEFDIDGTGQITYTGTGEDFETPPTSYTFKAVATDVDDMKGEADVTVTIRDEQEGPMFAQSRYDLELDENVPGTVRIGTLTATDPEGDRVYFTLEGDDALNFAVSYFDGVVSYRGTGEDFEDGPKTYEFAAVATSRGDLTGEATIAVTIQDVNEAPTFDAAGYTFELKENVPGPIIVGRAPATDPDGNKVIYSLSGAGSTKFTVAGGDISYSGSGEDFEEDPGPFEFMVIGTDPSGLSASANITVDVTDQNEAPTFDATAYDFTLSENQPGPVSLGTTNASDPDNDALRFTLTGGSGKFAVDETSGEVRYTGTGEDFEGGPGSYSLTVTATDAGNLSASAAVNVTILDENEAPTVAAQISDFVIEVGSSRSADIGAAFSDPDGDALSYSATSSATAVASVSIAGTDLVVSAASIGTATVSVVASDPSGLSAELQVTVTVEASKTERARTLQLSLAAMARTIGTETVDVLGTRMDAARGRDHVQVMGHSLECGVLGGGQDCSLQSFAQTATGILGLHAPSQRGLHSGPGIAAPSPYVSARGMGGSFGLAHGSASALAHSSFQASNGAFTLWGQGNISGFEGDPEDGFSMKGKTTSMYFGGDYQFGARVMLGLAVSLTSGDIDFMSSLNGDGTIEVSMTGFHPYLRYSPRAGLDFWGVAGAGSGTADLSEELGDEVSTDLSMKMAAAGVRQELTGAFALKADVFTVMIASDGNAMVSDVDASSQRLRVAPEFGVRRSNGTASYSGHVEIGLRIDGGDIDNGFGAEAAFAGGYAHAPSGLSLDLRARALLVHQSEGYTDWGASVALRLSPGGDEGLAIAVEPSWGNAHGGAEAFMRQEGSLGHMIPYGQLKGMSPRPDRVGVQVGYKMPVSSKARMAPFGRWTNSAMSGYQIQAGTRLAIVGKKDSQQPVVSMDVFAEQHVNGNVMGNARVGLRGIVRLN